MDTNETDRVFSVDEVLRTSDIQIIVYEGQLDVLCDTTGNEVLKRSIKVSLNQQCKVDKR